MQCICVSSYFAISSYSCTKLSKEDCYILTELVVLSRFFRSKNIQVTEDNSFYGILEHQIPYKYKYQNEKVIYIYMYIYLYVFYEKSIVWSRCAQTRQAQDDNRTLHPITPPIHTIQQHLYNVIMGDHP